VRYSVKFMDSAVKDYNDIVEYLSQFYPSTPKNFLNELDVRVEQLKDFPYSYPVFRPIPRYRRAIVMKYVLFYKVFDNRGIVEIHRIIHTAQNIPEMIE